MSFQRDYLSINKKSWDSRVDAHVASDFYAMPAFLSGKSSLKEIETKLLGDISGQSILHLQCHFGQDTLSLQRMGASCVGVDLSGKAIEKAKALNEELELEAKFVECDVFDTPQHVDGQFDLVFTSYGTIGWLPDLTKWAGVIDHFLKPSGKLVFVEFHPVVWMFDDDFEAVKYRYLNNEPIEEDVEGTYADTKTKEVEGRTITWNHGLSEVVQALLKRGLRIDSFEEYDYSPYDCFRHTVEFEPGKFRIKHLGDKIPMVYSLVVGK